MDGLLRYNEIQKALAPLRKAKGWKLPVGGFQQIASRIYHRTKGQSIQRVTSRIESIWSTLFFPEELLDDIPFFAFDFDSPNKMGVFNPLVMSDDLYVKSPQLQGPDFFIPISSLTYADHFHDFTDYCNSNRGVWWTDSSGAPTFHFTLPEYDPTEEKWYSTLALGDENAYGYTPGLGPTVTEGTVIKKPEKPAPEPEKEPEKETELAKAETERLRASESRIAELNKAVDKLDSQLERGLITKTEYKKYLKRLYEL